MSDHILRVIPTDPHWVGEAQDIARTREAVGAAAPGASELAARVHDGTRFIDPGQNWSGVACPSCGRELELRYWQGLMSRSAETRFEDLSVRLTCCGARTTLNDLAYGWPAGFAHMEIAAWNGHRPPFSEEELARFGAVLGHPVRQIACWL